MRKTRMVTTIDTGGVTFMVLDRGTDGESRCIWKKRVAFGDDDRRVAGGWDFQEAAREQERVAWENAVQGRDPDERM